MNPMEQIDLAKIITLDRLPVAVQQSFGASVLQSLDLSFAEDVIYGGLTARLRAYLQADHLADATHTAHSFSEPRPVSWWQHTKLVHFPTLSRWLRRPPRMTRDKVTVTVDVRSFAAFPESSLVYPTEFGRPTRVQILTSDLTRERDQ